MLKYLQYMGIIIWIIYIASLQAAANEKERANQLLWGVVSTLPDQMESEFAEKLQEISAETTGTSMSVAIYHTFGSDSRINEFCEKFKKEDIHGLIFMDMPSVIMVKHFPNIPCVVLAPTSGVLNLETSNENSLLQIIETLPPPEKIYSAAKEIMSSDTMVGIIYASDEPGHLDYLGKLNKLLTQNYNDSMEMQRCPIEKGACRNLIDVQYGLEKNFLDMAEGDIIIVLPAANAIKFSFAIKQYAESKGIILIGVEKFRTIEPHAYVAYTSRELAKKCVELLIRK